MTKIIFIRHGQTLWNAKRKYQGQTDIHLDETGIMQADLVAQKLKEDKVDVIYASDLQRAYKTAEIIGLEQELKVSPSIGLREFNFGVWEGKTYEELKNEYPELVEKWFKDPESVQIPKAESIKDLQNRAVNQINEILEKHNNKTVVVVSHGLTIATILSYFLDIELKNVRKMIQGNTGITIVEFNDTKGTLVVFNDINHIENL
ncbi:alpha-ribazole phosphatase [Desulfonispora thiosulfatigenes DSM 11270]|uniref:Alpha-ribazole phosphatase n=1 Tax=Desulfonispora thiosulfatigenes DSM 11270 TaxID=656914 RepID=A0A1W1VSP6_DESTI|nr:histidine phosphatase family protein [Desulfonispora thiosulfatigenes]SMB96250.1 alpha-ribazole phosphatase [Desulfonispora thiosulfatigenes DSM 11270]